MYPVTITFGRQQLGELTHIDDDVLGYWMREGLLRPIAGKGGKGQHRRFDYRQVHIVALLGEMRNIGVNIGGLKSFAAILQRGIEIADSGPWSRDALLYAARISWDAARFHAGEPVSVFEFTTYDLRPAVSLDEIVKHETLNEDIGTDSASLLKLALSLNEYDQVAANCYSTLISDSNLVERGTDDCDWEERVWFVSADSSGGWTVRDSELIATKRSGMRCGVALAVSLIIRRLWIPAPTNAPA